MSYVTTTGGPYRVGGALEAMFAVLRARPGLCFGLSFLFIGVPNLLIGLVGGGVGYGAAGAGAPAASVLAPFGLFALVVGLVGFALQQGALSRAVVSELNGGRPTLGDCVRQAGVVLLPLIGIFLLSAIGMGFGFLFLIVPGLLLATLWAVNIPAEVVERRGVFTSFSRSLELTRGSRWPVFGTLVLLFICTLVISMIGFALVAAMAGGFSPAAVAAMTWPMVGIRVVLNAAISSIAYVFYGAGAGAIYYELRRSKEGFAPAALAKVFD